MNILSLTLVQEKYHVKYDNEKDLGFMVTKPTGEFFIFIQSKTGLHYLDTSKQQDGKLVDSNEGNVFMINTVTDNKSQRAVWVRELQVIIGHLSTTQYNKMIEKNLLPNCPVMAKDIQAAEMIFGPEIGALK